MRVRRARPCTFRRVNCKAGDTMRVQEQGRGWGNKHPSLDPPLHSVRNNAQWVTD